MIQGNLNFSNAGGNLFYGDPAAQYKNAYNAALSLNQQNYSNILKGYQQTMAEQKAAQQGVVAGYNQLQGDVLNRLSGSNAAAIQAINDRYSQDQGNAAQQLVSRGLGNTTVQSAVNRGLSLDRAKAELGAQNQLQQNIANYQTQIGMGKLGFQGNAIGANTSLGVKQLDWMDSIKAPYPDAGAYMKLAEMKARAQPPMYPNFGPMGGGGYPMMGGGGGGGGIPPTRNPFDPDAANMRYWNSWQTGNSDPEAANMAYWNSWTTGGDEGNWNQINPGAFFGGQQHAIDAAAMFGLGAGIGGQQPEQIRAMPTPYAADVAGMFGLGATMGGSMNYYRPSLSPYGSTDNNAGYAYHW